MSVLLQTAPAKLPLVVARHRHLKWKALDPLEHVLMVICGLSIIGFTSSVFLDVLTRKSALPFPLAAIGDHRLFRLGDFYRHGHRNAPHRPPQFSRDHQAVERAEADLYGDI